MAKTAGKKPGQKQKGKARDDSGARVHRLQERESCIGKIRPVRDPARRELCRYDLMRYLLEYLSATFSRPFCQSHLDLIATIETVILKGGCFVNAQPRGFGKSTILEGAISWSASYGHRFVNPLLSTIKSTAQKSMKSIQTEFETNPAIAEDFPEICQPIEYLEGIAQRANAQTYIDSDGEVQFTGIEYKTEEIVLPWIEGSPSAGVYLCCFGLRSSRARGIRAKRRDGTQVRPDFYLIDDPQDRKIAASPIRVDNLRDHVDRDILMSQGHDRKAACAVIATVIERRDYVDGLLQNPNWIGRRVGMLRSMPANLEKWTGKYKEIRTTYKPGDAEDKRRAEAEATALYQADRAAMDAGAVPSWPECFNSDEVSAIQHAMNIYCDLGPRTFWSECMNEPLDPFASAGQVPLEAGDILQKATTLPRGQAPLWAHTLTAFVDVGQRTNLHYAVLAAGARFSCHVLDYGRVEVRKSAQVGLEAAIHDALERAAQVLIGRVYQVENGAGEKRLDRLLVDSGWQSRTVYNWARERDRQAPGLVRPSKGYSAEKYRGPKPGTGARRGDNWHLALSENRAAHIVHFNVDHWKSFLDARLRVGLGGAGALSFCRGTDLELAEQVTSERPTRKQARSGDAVDVWRLLPGRANHFLDCLVGCLVAASTCGVSLEEIAPAKAAKKKTRAKAAQSLSL